MARLPRPKWLGIGSLDDQDSYFSLGYDFYFPLFADFDDRLAALADDFVKFALAERKAFENRFKFAGKVAGVDFPRPPAPALFWFHQNAFSALCMEYVERIYNARENALKRQNELILARGRGDTPIEREMFLVALSYWENWRDAVFRVLDYATFWVFKYWQITFENLSCVSTALKIQFKPNYKATNQVGFYD